MNTPYPPAVARISFGADQSMAEQWYQDDQLQIPRDLMMISALTFVIMNELGQHV